jgi:hypothetical protein
VSRIRSIRWNAPRIALAVLVVLVTYYVLTAVLFSAGPKGKRSSSYGTVPSGLSAWADLLEKRGHRVTHGRQSLDTHPPNPDSTLILVEGAPIDSSETGAIRRFVRSGGRLILGGSGPVGLADDIVGDPAKYTQPGDRVLGPVIPAVETAGVSRVVGNGEGRLTDSGPAIPLLAGRNGIGVAVAREGRGRVFLVADPSPLRNRFLGRADNAALAVGLAGSPKRPVQFVETIHGYGRESGLSALPTRWKTALILLAIAGIVFLLARGKRFGPPEQRDRELPPPRAAYADALAATLARTNDRHVAIEPIHAAARRQVAHRSGLGPDPSADVLQSAARRLGLSEEEARAVAADEDFDMIATGRALARLNGGQD